MRYVSSSVTLALVLLVGFVLVGGYRHFIANVSLRDPSVVGIPSHAQPVSFGVDANSVRQTQMSLDCRSGADWVLPFHTNVRFNARRDGGAIAWHTGDLPLDYFTDKAPRAFEALVRDLIRAGVGSMETDSSYNFPIYRVTSMNPNDLPYNEEERAPYRLTIAFSQGPLLRSASFIGWLAKNKRKSHALSSTLMLETDNSVCQRILDVLDSHVELPFPHVSADFH